MSIPASQSKSIVYKDIKQIIQKVLAQHKSSFPSTQSIIDGFRTKRKLLTLTRLQKANKNLSIFKQLNSFINVSEVFDKVKRQICQYVCKQPLQRKSSRKKSSIIIKERKSLDQKNIRQDMKYFDDIIQQAYGKKIERRNFEHAQELERIISKTPINQPQKFYRSLDMLVKNLNDEEIEAQNKRIRQQKINKAKFPIKKLYLTSREKQRVEEYCHIALTLLGIILTRQKNALRNKKSFNKTHQFHSLHQKKTNLFRSTRPTTKFITNFDNQAETKGQRLSCSLSTFKQSGNKSASVYATVRQSIQNQTAKKKVRFNAEKKQGKRKLKRYGNQKYISESMNSLLQEINFETKYNDQNKNSFENYITLTNNIMKASEDEGRQLIKEIEQNIIDKCRKNTHNLTFHSKSKRNI